MNINDIPYVKLTGIKQTEDQLKLDFNDEVLNHVGTVHAAAQFTLAETKSGTFLQGLFPNMEDEVIAVLRDANIKYKKPALETIEAFASIEEEALEKFKTQLEKKKRASVEINVLIKDINDVLTSQGTFTWYIQIK